MKFTLFILSIICIMSMPILLTTCTKEQDIETLPTNPADYSSNESDYWIEIQGDFFTRDLERAQREIPFSIILPSYLPSGIEEDLQPVIEGPLKEFQKADEIKVKIKYPLYLDTNLPGLLIELRNYHIALANPETEPLNIREVPVYFEMGNFVPGPGFIFNFQNDGIYYIVEIYNLTFEESTKVIESMIKQMN